MPTELIPDEDRFVDGADILSGWTQVCDHLAALPGSVSRDATHMCKPMLDSLLEIDGEMADFSTWLGDQLRVLYTPRVMIPFWCPSACARVHCEPSMHSCIVAILGKIESITQDSAGIITQCATSASLDAAETEAEIQASVYGGCAQGHTIDRTPACFLSKRFTHKLLTLLCWLFRAMDSRWVAQNFALPGDFSSATHGSLPALRPSVEQPAEVTHIVDRLRVGYVALRAPQTGLRTLVPLIGYVQPPSKFGMLHQHLGSKSVMMVISTDGVIQRDRGLFLFSTSTSGIVLCATTGWTGGVTDSFTKAPVESHWRDDKRLVRDHSAMGSRWLAAVHNELAARKRSDYFHIIPAVQMAIPAEDWPSTFGSSHFIATPQRGLESDLVELSLLESIVEDAAAGNESAQLLLTQIESECAAPIAEVIAAQKSRLEQMLEDQAAQLRIHAEAVKRAELRGRIKAPAADEDSVAVAAAASSAASSVTRLFASSSSSSFSAVAPATASSSSSTSSTVSAASASAYVPGPAFSWTQSKEFKSVESLRETGRLKYRTIMSAAKKLLYSLRPVSVNKTGGSHLVFHFASGAPATLVQMHAGSKSKDGTAYSTRLFAQLSVVAAEQMGGSMHEEIAGTGMAALGAGGARRIK